MDSIPKRILHICHSSEFASGTRAFIMHLYRNIEREKVQFDFLRFSNNEHDYYDEEILSLGGKLYRIVGRKPDYLKHLKEMENFFKNNRQYDTIHFHTSSNLGIFFLIKAKKYGVKKIIYHSHNNKSQGNPVLEAVFNFIYKPRIKKYATHYFACSDLAAKHLFGNYIDSSKIKIINNAVDTDKFLYNEQIRYRIHNELGISNKFVIGYVGRFAPQKNPMFLLDIFAEVYKKNSNAVLLLVGEGELRGNVEKKIADLGLGESVIMTGVRSDVNELMQAMDVFLLPSLYEGLGIVLIEAQTSGLHSITSADVVPQLAKVTDLLEYVSLKEPASYWADQVLRYGYGYKRKNMRDEIKKAGFDIKELTGWFEEFYLEK